MRAVLQQRRQVGVLDARLDEPEARMGERPREIALLDRPRVVVGEAIDADDVGAVGEQPLGERRSDEPGNAGDQCLHENNVLTRSGSRHGRPARSSVACTVVPVASVAASASAHHFVGELHAHRREQRPRRPHLEVVVVLRRFAIRAVRFDHRQREALDLHLAIAPARLAQQVGAADLEPHEVVRVVDDAHLVGFGVAHAHPGLGLGRSSRIHRGTATGGTAASAAALSSRTARSGSGRVEDRRPGDDHARAGGHHARDVVQIDAAVDLDQRVVARPRRAAPARPALWTRCAE